MSDNQVNVNITAQTGQFNSSLKTAGNEFKSFSDVLTNNISKLTAAFVGLSAAFAIKGIADLEAHFGQLAEEIDRVSQMTGLAIREVQQFTSVVELSGGSVEGGVATLVKLERSMAEAAKGTGDTALAFKTLGIDVLNADGKLRTTQEVLGDLAEKFKNSENGAIKTAYAMQLMGRGGAQLIPVLNKGKDGLDEFNKALVATNSLMNESQQANFARLDDKIDLLSKSWEGFKLAVADFFEPAAEVIVGWMTKIVQSITDAIQSVNTFIAVSQELFNRTMGVKSPKSDTSKKDSLPIANTEKSLADAKKISDAQITLDAVAASKSIAIQEEQNRHKLAIGVRSFSEYSQQSMNLENRKYDIEKASLQKRLDAVKNDEAERLKILAKLQEAEGKHLARQEQIENAAKEHINQNYQNMFNNISSGFENMTEKLIRGTAAWRDAFRSMCADMIVAFAKMQVANIAKLLWAAAIDKEVTIASAITKRAANAVSAAGGAYQAVVGIPYIGPVLAPAAAVAAFAGVMAFGLPSAAGGWDEVPQDGMAMIHKKEMVLPAPLAEKVRNMSEGGGGGNYNVTIQAVDSKSFGDMIKRNPNFIMDAIQNQSRNFNVNAPGWRTA